MSIEKEAWLNGMIGMLGIEAEELLELVDIFFDEMPETLNEIRQAYNQGEMVEVKRLAHSLKGAAQTFMLTEVAERAYQLELQGGQGHVDDIERHLSGIAQTLAKARDFLR